MNFIPECTNLSVGYTNQHTPNEAQYMKPLLSLLESVQQVKWDELPTKRDPAPKKVFSLPPRQNQARIPLGGEITPEWISDNAELIRLWMEKAFDWTLIEEFFAELEDMEFSLEDPEEEHSYEVTYQH
jgi:hypothetical protein